MFKRLMHCMLLTIIGLQAHVEKRFAVVVPTYNNSGYCIRNINSILCQNYESFHVYIIDDASTDDTYEKLYAFLNSHEKKELVSLTKNASRVGAMANYYGVIHQLDDEVIVLCVDGDDFLAHDHVLHRLNETYQNSNIWLTYGQFRQYPSREIGFCKMISAKVIEKHAYRSSAWLSSHLRTFYAWLFKRIVKDDLCYDGAFVPACYDRAMMYPMLEMCAGHFTCIDEVLYIYNTANPIADIQTKLPLQQQMCKYICSLPAYAPINGINGKEKHVN